MKYVPKVPVDIKSALHQIMTWNQAGVRPLYEVIITQFTHVYMGYEASMSETHYIAYGIGATHKSGWRGNKKADGLFYSVCDMENKCVCVI